MSSPTPNFPGKILAVGVLLLSCGVLFYVVRQGDTPAEEQLPSGVQRTAFEATEPTPHTPSSTSADTQPADAPETAASRPPRQSKAEILTVLERRRRREEARAAQQAPATSTTTSVPEG